ncbi:MAG TPA: 30S ribosomal protein S1 [Lentisphaeria bacterium]|jgi:small subunit ribosomal protein S1|nr:30S ribosomal protein S1 [Lentisphaeria bacterium]
MSELDKSLVGFHSSFSPGEQVTGVIISITRDWVFVDVRAKSEGIIPRQELERDGEISVKEGDEITSHFSHQDSNGIHLMVRVGGKDSDQIDEALADAAASGIPVEGKVAEERKGGFEVTIGSQRAFCPYSQIDMHRRDAADHLGRVYSFLVTEYADGNLVVSRRKLMEQEQQGQIEVLKERLQVGEIIGGEVTRLADFGAFVELGGTEGLIPMREMAWKRVETAGDVVQPGQTVQVKILSLDWARNRISLSLREAQGDPWGKAENSYHVSNRYHGKVVRLMPFGAFVELEPGIEGLVHISKLGAGKRLRHAAEVLHEDEELEVYIQAIDIEKRRISLTMENPQLGRTMDVDGAALTVGQQHVGKVEEIRPFGVFVRLTDRLVGLLHVSEVSIDGAVNPGKALWKRHPPGSEVTVVVKSIHNDRVSLMLPDSGDDDSDEFREYLSGSQDDFGSVGSAFDGLSL